MLSSESSRVERSPHLYTTSSTSFLVKTKKETERGGGQNDCSFIVLYVLYSLNRISLFPL